MDDTAVKYGFEISRVTWGYREKFREMIRTLVREGFIRGNDTEASFYGFLKEHTGASFDDVIHKFLQALNSGQRWILRNPYLFRWWCSTGTKLARKKVFAGIAFFKISADGGLGRTPGQTQAALTHIDALLEDKFDLVSGFMNNFKTLSQRLTLRQIARFVQEAEHVYSKSPQAGADFIEGRLESSEILIRRLTSEAVLSDIAPLLKRIVKSVSGRSIEIHDLGKLDSDELLVRGSRTVAFSRWMYLPLRMTDFGPYEQNRRYYKLTAVVCGVCYLFQGFAGYHGKKDFFNLKEYLRRTGFPEKQINRQTVLFELCEYARIFRRMYRVFPGSRKLVGWGIRNEFDYIPPSGESDILLQHVLNDGNGCRGRFGSVLSWIDHCASQSNSFSETAGLIREAVLQKGVDLSAVPPGLRRLTFFPDPLFAADSSQPFPDTAAVDTGSGSRRDTGPEPESEHRRERSRAENTKEREGKKTAARQGFLYDEWNGIQGEYYKNWCFLEEKQPRSTGFFPEPAESGERSVEKTKNIFERVKPDLNRKEKYLYDGDIINIDRLIDYITLRKASVQGREDFYEKMVTKRRSLAVAIMIDISGSTGSEVNEQTKILDVEKQAASILAEGLALLGDTFALYGFTGNGRENCEFYVFKDFNDEWDSDARNRLFSVYPGTSTRIGVALRHAGRKMRDIDSKRKLILMLTDGKPMDSEYDPDSGYAYYDVRKACAENSESGIQTFGIITEDENGDNIQKMFQKNSFSVILDINKLPEKLARYFLYITV